MILKRGEKKQKLGENLSQFHFVNLKSHKELNGPGALL